MQLVTVNKVRSLIKKDKYREVVEERCKPYKQQDRFYLPILVNEGFRTEYEAWETSSVIRKKLHSLIDGHPYFYIQQEVIVFDPRSLTVYEK